MYPHMEAKRRKLLIVLTALLLLITVALIGFAIYNHKANQNKSEKPPPEEPSGGSSGGSSGSSSGSLPNGPSSPALGPSVRIESSEFGRLIQDYLDDKDDCDRAVKAGNVGLKPALIEIKKKEYANPKGDGTCGYIALFAALYPFLINRAHPIHQRFFDTTRYDAMNLPHAPQNPCATIEDLFKRLEAELQKYNNVQDFLNCNQMATVVALRYIILKHVWDVDKAIVSLLIERGIKDSSYNQSGDTPQKRLDFFKNVYVRDSLTNLTGGKFWLSTTDALIYSLIFNINIWMIHFDTGPRLGKNSSGDDAVIGQYKYNVRPESSYNVRDPPLASIYDNTPLKQRLGAPIETVYLFNSRNVHFLAVLG